MCTKILSCIHFRQGQDFGDEYFAELDMIESVEGRKEGYESDVDEGKCTSRIWIEGFVLFKKICCSHRDIVNQLMCV